jgi:hypothetical protein
MNGPSLPKWFRVLAALGVTATICAVPSGSLGDTIWRCRTKEGDEGFFINTKPNNAKCTVYSGGARVEPARPAKGAKCRTLRFGETMFFRCEKDGVTWAYNRPVAGPSGAPAGRTAGGDAGMPVVGDLPPGRLGGRDGPGADLAALVTKASAESGIPEALLKAVIEVESGFRPDVVSPAGAQGLMQLMPLTADGLEVEDPFDPEQNVRAGARLLRQLSDRFAGDLEQTVAAYYAGATAVRRAGGPPDDATVTYVRKVVDRYRRYAATEPGVR